MYSCPVAGPPCNSNTLILGLLPILFVHTLKLPTGVDIGINFTSDEADSLQDNVREYNMIYQAMHRSLPANSLSFPFAFQPAPYGFKIPVAQQKIVWNIPTNVSLPANKNDLAFYSITQLASL